MDDIAESVLAAAQAGVGLHADKPVLDILAVETARLEAQYLCQAAGRFGKIDLQLVMNKSAHGFSLFATLAEASAQLAEAYRIVRVGPSAFVIRSDIAR
jgi:hypothetical protein